MEEKEKNQKTLIAIVAGLIIGGLLVWVFSSAPSDQASEETGDTLASEEENAGNTESEEDADVSDDTPSRTIVTGGSVAVADQKAGPVVTLGNVGYPSNAGWIVVREELADGSLGNILGASRFNVEGGLSPKEVRLLRNTEPSKTYHVMIYSENGDNVFDLADDMPVETASGAYVEAVFKTS